MYSLWSRSGLEDCESVYICVICVVWREIKKNKNRQKHHGGQQISCSCAKNTIKNQRRRSAYQYGNGPDSGHFFKPVLADGCSKHDPPKVSSMQVWMKCTKSSKAALLTLHCCCPMKTHKRKPLLNSIWALFSDQVVCFMVTVSCCLYWLPLRV